MFFSRAFPLTNNHLFLLRSSGPSSSEVPAAKKIGKVSFHLNTPSLSRQSNISRVSFRKEKRYTWPRMPGPELPRQFLVGVRELLLKDRGQVVGPRFDSRSIKNSYRFCFSTGILDKRVEIYPFHLPKRPHQWVIRLTFKFLSVIKVWVCDKFIMVPAQRNWRSNQRI